MMTPNRRSELENAVITLRKLLQLRNRRVNRDMVRAQVRYVRALRKGFP